MVHFGERPKPRDYLSGSQQRRLLFLVLGLGVVVILAIEARNPARWRWIDELDQPAPAPPRREVPPPQELPGTFQSPGPAPAASPIEPSPTAESDAPARRYPGVKTQWLAAIRDDTAFRPEETEALVGLWTLLRKSDPARLQAASAGRVTRPQLFEQSAAYRGELVTVCGTARRAVEKPAPANEAGITRYFELWIQPADSPDWPVAVYCLELPEGFPSGAGLSERVGATGFYFKRWLYRSQRGLEVAPLVLARSVQWRPAPPAAPSPTPSATGLAVATLGALAVAALVTVYVFRRTGGGRAATVRRDGK